MLPVSSAVRRQAPTTTYVCLSCRLRSRKREAAIKAASIDNTGSDGPKLATPAKKNILLKPVRIPRAYSATRAEVESVNTLHHPSREISNPTYLFAYLPPSSLVASSPRAIDASASSQPPPSGAAFAADSPEEQGNAKPASTTPSHEQARSHSKLRKHSALINPNSITARRNQPIKTSPPGVYGPTGLIRKGTVNDLPARKFAAPENTTINYLCTRKQSLREQYVRKQYGTPYATKLAAEKTEVHEKSLEALLDAHRDVSEGRDVDLEALDAQLNRSTGSGRQSSDAVLGNYVPIRAARLPVRTPSNKPEIEDHKLGENALKSEKKDQEAGDKFWKELYRREKENAHASPTEYSTTQSRSRSQPSSSPLGPPLSPHRYFHHLAGSTAGPTFQARLMHTSSQMSQQSAVAIQPGFDQQPLPSMGGSSQKDSSIRAQLRQWQEVHGVSEDTADQPEHDRDIDMDGTHNSLTRLPSVEQSFQRRDMQEEEEQQVLAHFMRSATHDLDSAATDSRFLKIGDLVELEFLTSEQESVIAVFVRRIGRDSQFFTMQGRWVILPERMIQYSIPDWVSPELVNPVLPYLPDPQTLQEREELGNQAYMYDLAVPRAIASGLVSRMVQFHTESQEVYRRHASTLDNAHQLLAHERDLRYGSLLSATTTLLKMHQDDLPLTALYTVRKALSRAGFAFNIDRRSHRLTGYLQIRSKEQVKMVEKVRGWLRDWQDDMAKRASLENEGRKVKSSRTPQTAQHVYDFIHKVKKIVLKSRENRDPTPHGNVGPSKKTFPIRPGRDCVEVTMKHEFTEEDTEIVKFVEAWACSNMFFGHPRLESLPPLLLQATGLYEDMDLKMWAGWLFLQEIGTITPYDNRIRFDQHLLLPSSQHSKPLENLMTSLMEMRHSHNFRDTMRDLRHDWKDLSVYCIDDAGAQEIDDGLSIERAGDHEWWVHVHIANPTAFFERDHPLAKMSRHMGESIYMPERTYAMMPRWATKEFFSLAPNRPCLTISTRMDAEGNTLERKIRPGIVRNVLSLTPADIASVLGTAADRGSETVLTVGGSVPPLIDWKSSLSEMSEEQLEEIKMLQRLAEKRSDIRRRAGGVFFDMKKPEIEVFQAWKKSGLSWDYAYRKGSRIVEGDPVIRMRTEPLSNWFKPRGDSNGALVQEMMLLACETAASWCSERQIPAIFRGVLRRPDRPDPDIFRREILEPALQQSADAAYPMHLGIEYVLALGGTALSSKPFKHALLGMDHYGKVTSPLRRYGDMILHWQIEGALREEARRAKTLVTSDPDADRSFLPFSRPVLDTIMLGLQPRESIISRSKAYAESFWSSMLLFRAFHFDQAELPFWTEAHPTRPDGSVKPHMRCFIHASETSTHLKFVNALSVDLNVSMSLERPDWLGMGEALFGDVWECAISRVDVYRRTMFATPVRLVSREKMGMREVREVMAKFKSE